MSTLVVRYVYLPIPTRINFKAAIVFQYYPWGTCPQSLLEARRVACIACCIIPVKQKILYESLVTLVCCHAKRVLVI